MQYRSGFHTKAGATRVWIGAANTVAKDTGRKPWRYALIPHDAVDAAATLDGLMGRFGQTAAPLGPLFQTPAI